MVARRPSGLRLRRSFQGLACSCTACEPERRAPLARQDSGGAQRRASRIGRFKRAAVAWELARGRVAPLTLFLHEARARARVTERRVMEASVARKRGAAWRIGRERSADMLCIVGRSQRLRCWDPCRRGWVKPSGRQIRRLSARRVPTTQTMCGGVHAARQPLCLRHLSATQSRTLLGVAHLAHSGFPPCISCGSCQGSEYCLRRPHHLGEL